MMGTCDGSFASAMGCAAVWHRGRGTLEGGEEEDEEAPLAGGAGDRKLKSDRWEQML